ncbi:hypothetical protein RHECNPAF_122100135 [Rhizobium etli CNPAF512]|nr:hypothetical protein RHECNPAF_122100135 [Rhizobium etli CNPAF512]
MPAKQCGRSYHLRCRRYLPLTCFHSWSALAWQSELSDGSMASRCCFLVRNSSFICMSGKRLFYLRRSKGRSRHCPISCVLRPKPRQASPSTIFAKFLITSMP